MLVLVVPTSTHTNSGRESFIRSSQLLVLLQCLTFVFATAALKELIRCVVPGNLRFRRVVGR